jgi:glycosyltransferase involved in cell wall biosynthesis
MPTLCLNMIVKNEAHVLARYLASVKPWIDSWVIVDTGSSDGTQALIRGQLQGLPGPGPAPG